MDYSNIPDRSREIALDALEEKFPNWPRPAVERLMDAYILMRQREQVRRS